MRCASLLLASSLVIGTPAFADPNARSAEAADGQYYTTSEKTDFRASELIGSRVYASEAAVDTSKAIEKADAEWDDIGEVNNLIVSRDGSVRAVVVGVGGFLGIGEKNVALRMGELKFLKKAGDDADDYFIVVNNTKAGLEKAPEYKAAD